MTLLDYDACAHDLDPHDMDGSDLTHDRRHVDPESHVNGCTVT
jgi:hypothetical protein